MDTDPGGAAASQDRAEPNRANTLAAPASANADAKSEGRGAELASPVVFSFTLLRLTALLAASSAIFAKLVLPGARGTLPEATVVLLERVAATASYAQVGLMTALLAAGSFELARMHRMNGLFRGFLIGVMSLALAIASPALGLHLGAVAEVVLSFVVSVVTLTSAAACMRPPHTRAVAAALLAVGVANVTRLIAWLVSESALDSADMGRYALARVVATASTIAWVTALGVATVWVGTRAQKRSAPLAVLALAISAAITYFALRDAEAPAALADVLGVLRRALAGAEGSPAPYGIGALAVLCIPASVLLSIASSVQKPHHAAGPLLALALTTFAAFDVPIAALTALTATVWLPLLADDPRLLWQSLLPGKRELKNSAVPRATGNAERATEPTSQRLGE